MIGKDLETESQRELSTQTEREKDQKQSQKDRRIKLWRLTEYEVWEEKMLRRTQTFQISGEGGTTNPDEELKEERCRGRRNPELSVLFERPVDKPGGGSS